MEEGIVFVHSIDVVEDPVVVVGYIPPQSKILVGDDLGSEFASQTAGASEMIWMAVSYDDGMDVLGVDLCASQPLHQGLP
jgi:hypothetical protein